MLKKNNILCGFQAVLAALSSRLISDLYVDRNRSDTRMTGLIERASAEHISIHVTNKEELDLLAKGIRHQGVIAISKSLNTRTGILQFLSKKAHPLVLILDGIQDPGNLGNCLRNGAAAGVDAVLIPRKKGCALTQTAIRVAAGGAACFPIFEEGNWTKTLNSIKSQGIWLIGLDEKGGDSLYTAPLSDSVALVLGSEDKGLRRITRECCDRLVHIQTERPVQSLNVGSAAGIALFEARRQRALSEDKLPN